MYGGDGNDTFHMSITGDEETFDGGDGADTVIVDLTSFTAGSFEVEVNLTTGDGGLSGSTENRDVFVDIENYTLFGGINVEMTGSSADNVLQADSGDDLLKGEAGADTLYGKDGDDTLFGGAGNDNLYGGGGDDKLYGGSGDDYIKGHSGDDYLKGHSGDDHLRGGSGEDRLRGNSGDDLLEGEAGDDTFIFDTGWGHDTITDFDVAGNEILDFTNIASVTSMSDLTISYGGADTVITFNGNSITLQDTTATLLVDDFVF